MGPNVKKLIAHKISRDAIPDGGGFVDGIKFLSDHKKVKQTARKAEDWVTSAICAIRLAKDPNPWKNLDDEQIAKAILRRIESRNRNL